MKIAIIGTHSTGKTTLLNELKKHFKDLPFITEVARNFPRDITDNPIKEMERQLSIFEAQLTQEVLFENGFISDRSTIDNAAYMSLALRKYNKYLPFRNYIVTVNNIGVAINHGDYYDYLFYIPIEFPVVDDGFRCLDEEERLAIDYIIKMLKPPKTIKIIGTVKERVNKVLEVLKC